MKIVPLFEASDVSFEREHQWMPLINGASERLREQLGEPELGDFLPGLAEVCAWGIRSESEISGAIYSDFIIDPTLVSVMVSSRVRDDEMLLDSVVAFMELFHAPAFSRIHMLSISRAERAFEVRDRGQLVLRTRSHAAADPAAKLSAKLVIGASVDVVASAPRSDEIHPLHVLTNTNGDVRNFDMRPEPAEVRSRTVSDWSTVAG